MEDLKFCPVLGEYITVTFKMFKLASSKQTMEKHKLPIDFSDSKVM
jgi:hypothetical protein